MKCGNHLLAVMLFVWHSLVCLRSVANGQTTNILVKFIMLKEHSTIYEIGKFLISKKELECPSSFQDSPNPVWYQTWGEKALNLRLQRVTSLTQILSSRKLPLLATFPYDALEFQKKDPAQWCRCYKVAFARAMSPIAVLCLLSSPICILVFFHAARLLVFLYHTLYSHTAPALLCKASHYSPSLIPSTWITGEIFLHKVPLLFTSEDRIPNKVPMQAHSLENFLQESGNVLPSDAKVHKKTELPTH